MLLQKSEREREKGENRHFAKGDPVTMKRAQNTLKFWRKIGSDSHFTWILLVNLKDDGSLRLSC